MKKILIIPLFILSLLSTACTNSFENNNVAINQKNINYSTQMSQAPLVAEKIEVVHFHATQQCWSCITVGEFALKTIQEYFPEEYANGTIIFKEINGELPENQEMVMKYQASGSSLFINAIVKDQDNIEEDTTVWRLVNDEQKFKDYLQNKLKILLSK